MSNNEYEQQQFWKEDKILLVNYGDIKVWFSSKEAFRKYEETITKIGQEIEHNLIYGINGK